VQWKHAKRTSGLQAIQHDGLGAICQSKSVLGATSYMGYTAPSGCPAIAGNHSISSNEHRCPHTLRRQNGYRTLRYSSLTGPGPRDPGTNYLITGRASWPEPLTPAEMGTSEIFLLDIQDVITNSWLPLEFSISITTDYHHVFSISSCLLQVWQCWPLRRGLLLS
jgi:hypothetical protein